MGDKLAWSMRNLNKLNPRFVDAAKAEGVYSDGGGLYLRVRGGGRSWVFVYYFSKKRRELGLGAPPAVGLAKARLRAQAARDLVADGKDPIEVKRGTNAVPTFGVLADSWIKDREASVKSPKSIDRWKRVLGDGEKAYAKTLRPLRVDEITTDHILAVLKPIWHKGATATLARSYIEAVLDAAKVRNFRVGDNPARWRGHLDHLLVRPKRLARGHHKAMPYADVPKFVARLRERDASAARMLEFTILTAARSGEALGCTWEEIALEERLWTIPAARMKAGKEHRVPLSERAVEVIKAAQPEEAGRRGPVFGSAGKAPSNMAMSMLMRRMGATDTVHGFRSAFREWAADEARAPREVAEAALAHTIGGVEAAYRRGDALKARRELMEAWARFCRGREGNNVVKLRA